jgi:hypothetical protein
MARPLETSLRCDRSGDADCGQGFAYAMTMTCFREALARLLRAEMLLAVALGAAGATACGGGHYEGAEAGAAGSNTGGGTSGSFFSSGSAASGSSSGSVASGNSTSDGCVISASSYTQSCNVDTDCQEVTSRNYCVAGCLCGGSAINVGALAQFNEDVSKTPLGSGALGGFACPCPASLGPCCRAGQCAMNCFSPADTLPACANAGGSCILSTNAICGAKGPASACAYSDETCCIN